MIELDKTLFPDSFFEEEERKGDLEIGEEDGRIEEGGRTEAGRNGDARRP